MRSSRRKATPDLYEDPRLYDMAFSYRDFAAECDGALAIAARHAGRPTSSILELACGPGHHVREFARRGYAATGIDLSRDMLAHAKSLARRDGVRVTFRRADMRTFRVPRKADLALCLFDSFAHCTTDADAIAALRATAAALHRGGVLILELSHPADFLEPVARRTLETWSERRGDVTVRARFRFGKKDAVAETYVATMSLSARYRDGRKTRRLTTRQLHRMWFCSGIANVASRCGAFDVVGWYGDLTGRVALSMGLESWRAIAVLRRR